MHPRPGTGLALARAGGEETVAATGWDHFAPAEVLA